MVATSSTTPTFTFPVLHFTTTTTYQDPVYISIAISITIAKTDPSTFTVSSCFCYLHDCMIRAILKTVVATELLILLTLRIALRLLRILLVPLTITNIITISIWCDYNLYQYFYFCLYSYLLTCRISRNSTVVARVNYIKTFYRWSFKDGEGFSRTFSTWVSNERVCCVDYDVLAY